MSKGQSLQSTNLLSCLKILSAKWFINTQSQPLCHHARLESL